MKGFDKVLKFEDATLRSKEGVVRILICLDWFEHCWIGFDRV